LEQADGPHAEGDHQPRARCGETAAALFASPHSSASSAPAINIDDRSGQWTRRN
jgi:hypothetical protein